MVQLLKTKKKLKRLSRLEIQILFTEKSLIKPVFSMIWLMVNQKTWQWWLSKRIRFKRFLIKKSSGSGVAALLANKSATEPNYQLANELHRQIIRKFKKRKVYSSSRDNIWGVHLAYMQSLSKYKRGIKYLLYAINFIS